MGFRKNSFKIKLIIFLEALIILFNSILGIIIWKQMKFMVREISRNKLMTIAKTTAYFIDAPTHEKIWAEEDMNGEDYKKIHLTLKKIAEANPEIDDIYTLRKSKINDDWTFVVEGYETRDLNEDGEITKEEQAAVIGEYFDSSYSPEVFNALKEPSADYNPSCDKWGCFLSGYAPIKDASGQTIAVATADIRVQNIIDFEKKTKIIILIILGFLFVFLPFIIYLFLIRITKPVTEIIDGISKFGHDLSTRIPIRSKDEFGIISKAFNNMASELQELYIDLEKKVREKTKNLEKKIDEIEEKKAKEEALFASIGEGIIATDKKGRIIISNNQFEKIIGTSSEKIINKKTFSVYNLLDEKEKPIPYEQSPEMIALNHASKTIGSFICERTDKTKIPIMITATPVIFKKETIGSIIVFRDITEEKAINKAKSEFVSLASHQLLTPLANIRWYTEMLLEENNYSKEKRRKYFSKIENSSQKMVELVQALLNVSRIEMGTFLIETQPTDILEIISSILDELNYKIKEKNLSISKKFPKKLDTFIADPRMLRVIFQNLLSNSVKYTRKNGQVEIFISKNKENLTIQVTDNGYGIPEDQKDKIFTKLFRADNVREEETDGTGLGLYITKSIVDNSGGKIWFESTENKVTNFYVKYPLSGMKNLKGKKEIIIKQP